MKTRILSLRVNRRAIGAAILTTDGLALTDGRHLASGSTRAVAAAVRYVEHLLNGAHINAVIVDSPAPGPGSVTDDVVASLKQVLSSAGLTPLMIGKADLLVAYGVPALRSRDELRAVVLDYWADLLSLKGRVTPYVIDAAAAALYAECRLALSPPPA
jgi:hypothetical protein